MTLASPLRPLHRRRRRRAAVGRLPADREPLHRQDLGDDRARQRAPMSRLPWPPPHRAFNDGAWPALTPSERGRLLWRLGDWSRPTRRGSPQIEQRDNGKLAAEVRRPGALHGRLLQVLRGPGRQGRRAAVIPTDKKGVFAYTRYEAKGVVGDHHAVELAADADQLEARAGARRRLHGGDQAFRVHLGLDARVRAAVRRGGLSRRAWSTSSPASAPRSARRWSRIRRSRTSASPAARRPAARSTSSRRATSRP